MILEIQILNIVIYRPLENKSSEFNHILNKLQRIFGTLEKPHPTIILSGDFNFPFVKWKRMPDSSCTWEYKFHTNTTMDEKGQFEKLLSICNNQFMLQTIEEPTRIENTLDLMFTNEISLITMIEVNNSNHSDHNKVEVSTLHPRIMSSLCTRSREMLVLGNTTPDKDGSLALGTCTGSE